MTSNRLYAEKICANPACETEFFPYDARQIFCEEQCRINFYNDKRKLKDHERFILEKQLRQNDQLLEYIYKSRHYKDDRISEEFLLDSGINMEIGNWEENLDTKRPIRWYHAFGLELVSKIPRIYTIHFRTKISQ
jgi:hypothetical protein